MEMFVAVDRNWAIAHKKKLLINIPSDLRWIINETENKVVVMGTDVLECLPANKLLPNRINIIVQIGSKFKESSKNNFIVKDIDEALNVIKKLNRKDVYFIGRICAEESVIEMCDVIHLTKVDYEYNADEFFINLNNCSEWCLVGETDEQTYYDIEFTCEKYVRN